MQKRTSMINRCFSFILSVMLLTGLFSCQKLSLAEGYFTNIENTLPGEETEPTGFYLELAVYSDNSCHIMTALCGEANSLSSVNWHSNCHVERHAQEFDIIDTSGNVIAHGLYRTQGPQREVDFDWSTPICEEWSRYAEKLGWTKPCRLRVKANLIDDIR